MTPPPVFIALTDNGGHLALRLRSELGGAVFGRDGRVAGADRTFAAAGSVIADLISGPAPIVWIGALGALVRLAAPHLRSKADDAPIVCVSEACDTVIPVVGGHHGANALASEIAEVLGVQPAITTATDSRFGVALDDPPAGWHLDPTTDYGGFAAALLAENSVTVDPTIDWLADSGLPQTSDARLHIVADHRATAQDPARLVYHPEVLAIGIGTERDADPAAVVEFVSTVIRAAGLADEAIALVTSVDVKMDEPAVHAVAHAYRRPARFFTPDRLETETPRLANPSDTVYAAVGCHGVAEAAALAAAGPDAHLIVPKQRGPKATCAIALTSTPIDAMAVGQARGKLWIVGLGPGTPDWRTAEAASVLADADDIVGFSGYLDLIGSQSPGPVRHPFPIGAETERTDHALDLAAQGRQVALVASGDPGIYALATLAFERLEHCPSPARARIDIAVSPGVSAFQAAAARLGAPMGHDFCAVSLSDLMTPWPAIERRLHAAASADFVTALYNPISLRRRAQLPRAFAIMAEHRPPDTPVAFARNLGRQDESITLTTLADADPETADMLTVVIIGASTTRVLQRRAGPVVYTPRGYADRTPQDTNEAASP